MFSDPGGIRTGDGGATLHVVSELHSELGDSLFERKGAYLNDVRTGRGLPYTQKEDAVREVAWILYCRSVPNTNKEEEVTKRSDKNWRLSFKYGPQGPAHPLGRVLQEDAEPQLHQQDIQGSTTPKIAQTSCNIFVGALVHTRYNCFKKISCFILYNFGCVRIQRTANPVQLVIPGTVYSARMDNPVSPWPDGRPALTTVASWLQQNF